MKVKLFWQKNCSKCPPSKEVCKSIEVDGIDVEYFDIQSVDGMAEAAFYNVLSTPTTVVVNKEEDELLCWRGETPDREKICRLRDS
ncbi:MAG: thioredoxin family protein [Candidatus Hydrothermarchaeaceae archaeon]